MMKYIRWLGDCKLLRPLTISLSECREDNVIFCDNNYPISFSGAQTICLPNFIQINLTNAEVYEGNLWIVTEN